MTTDAPRSANAFTVAAGGDEDLGDTRKRTAPPVSGGTVPDCGA